MGDEEDGLVAPVELNIRSQVLESVLRQLDPVLVWPDYVAPHR